MVQLRLIETGAKTSHPSAADSDGEESTLRPSVFYFRRALRDSLGWQEAVKIGHIVCDELEAMKVWAESKGYVPQKKFVLLSEAKECGYEWEKLDSEEVLS